MYEIAVGVEAETGGGKGGAQDLTVGHLFVIGIGIETGEQNGTPGKTWCASIGIAIELKNQLDGYSHRILLLINNFNHAKSTPFPCLIVAWHLQPIHG